MEDRNGPRFGYRCEEKHNQSLLLKLGMDVKGDQPDVHPIHFCHSRRPKATNIQRLSSILLFHSIGNHTCNPALIAQHAACFKSKKGGRLKKERINCGRPQSQIQLHRGFCAPCYDHTKGHLLSLSSFLPSVTVPLDDLT